MGAFTAEYCIEILKNKFKETGRLPKKSDFSVEESAAVKSFFGPWSRALEAAGIKERNEEKEQKKLQKKIEKKRRLTQIKIEKRKEK